jgi:nucleic acid/nucleotide deaminase of polymorphic system toxin
LTIAELAAGVRAALAHVADARDAVVGVTGPVEEAGGRYAELGKGSTQRDLADAAASLRTAYDRCREAVAILDQAVARANTYLASIAGSLSSSHAEPTTTVSRQPWQLTGEQVEKLRRELPPPITAAERGTGRKTHGRWVGGDGVIRTVVSGGGPLARAADVTLRRLGYQPLYAADHAEMKLATYLRQRWERTGTPQHATIVQNNEPCFGEVGCGAILPVMLPPGCSLTVHAPNYRRTFTGGATP